MQIRVSAIALLLGWVVVVSAHAESHLFRLSVDAAFANEFSTPDGYQLRSSAGALGGVGVGYRLAHKGFLFDVGVGASYSYISNGLNDSVYVEDMFDVQGEPYTGEHRFTERQDGGQRVSVNVPVMFGGEWGRWYALAGAKFNAALWTRTQEKGLYSLSGQYDRFIDPFEHMPVNGFVHNQPYENPPLQPSLTWDIRVCAEVGYMLNNRDATLGYHGNTLRSDYYLAVFAEYGVCHSAPLAPFVVGVRFTALWEIPKIPKCHCAD